MTSAFHFVQPTIGSRVTCCTLVHWAPTYDSRQSRVQGQQVAKQTGRRGNARARTLSKAGRVLLAMGLVVVGLALWATTTRIEAASNGLLLIGVPLMLLGGMLMGLDWMGSYTAAAEGSWDHHVNPGPGRTERSGPARGREADSTHRRPKRKRLFARSRQTSQFAASVATEAFAESPPQVEVMRPPQPLPAPRPLGVEPLSASPAPSGLDKAAEPARAPSTAGAGTAALPLPATALAAPPTPPQARREPVTEPVAKPVRSYRSDPGPDTVIEEFVGYEGQDRMLAVRAPAPQAPRELAWPHPPRTAVDVSAHGNEAFLEKLMDDVLAKLGTRAGPAPAASALVAGGAADSSSGEAPSAAAPSAVAPPPTPVWSPQTLHGADHWRFAALVEKLYQQAGFATQLQAGQTLRGVVVLWLFSRHRPGMPASVVRCVHAPGQALPVDEILALAELVKARGLPRGQLATTASVDAARQQLAAAQQVHLMDTQRLLELITRRTVEQQRALAARLA